MPSPLYRRQGVRDRPTLALDGVDDYAQAGDILDSTFTGAAATFTITAWIRSTRTSGWNDIIIGKFAGGAQDQREWLLRVYTSGKLDFLWYGGLTGVTSEDVLGTRVIGNDGRRHHIAVTFDANLALGSEVKLYVDGLLEAMTNTDTGIPAAIADGAAKLAIGEGVSSTDVLQGSPFQGEIDEVHIYNAVLTAAQVVSDMHLGPNGTEANLVAAWRCLEGTGGSLINKVSGGAAMTMSGTLWGRRRLP